MVPSRENTSTVAWRSAHGNARKIASSKSVRIETLPYDELPKGIPAPEKPEAPEERDYHGRFAKGSRTAQARGGKTKKNTVMISRTMSMVKLGEFAPAFQPYRLAGNAWRKAYQRWLAMTVGGGVCSAGASMLVKGAAMEISKACYFYDEFGKTGNLKFADKNSSSMDKAKSLIAASYELCAREAKSRAELMDMSVDKEQEEFRKKNFVETPAPEPKYEEFLEEAKAEVAEDGVVDET